ncbi:MAG: membrane protein insertase YidC [Deltaproteobacteria bacterium]|nr:membrane protein insertase YidC [Deltaproteobacteria bacterium]
MQKRMVLAIVLSFIIVFVYQYYFAKNIATKKQEDAQKQETVTTEQSSPAPRAAPAVKAAPKSISVQKSQAGMRDIRVETPLYIAVFTTKGGALKSLKLKDYRKELSSDSELIELVRVQEGQTYPLAVSFSESSISIPPDLTYDANTTAIQVNDKTGEQKIIFSATYPKAGKVEKVFTFFPDKYSIDLEVRVHNLSGNPIEQNAFLSWNEFLAPNVKPDKENEEGLIAYVKNSVEQVEVEKIEAKKMLGPDVSWGGFESKYFITALIPKKPTLTSFQMGRDASGRISASLEGPKNLIPMGQTGLFNYALYLGPKEYEFLKAEDVGLENAINLGSWIKWLAMPLLIFMKFLYKYVHNYGTAIIILTFLTKIVFWPLGNKSYKSMKEMQTLQPKIKELQERYKNDKQALNQAVMQLYKSHKINPLGGCLPVLIQIPVFFGLYRALLYSIELRHAPFVGWIQDLSARDPYYITPVIMGATMFLQQKMSPPMGTDPMQQKIMLLMPVVFTALFLNFPSGLVIYWLFNNILSIGQQYYINKSHAT